MSMQDNILILKYQKMISLGNINNNSGNTTIIGNISNNSNLNVSGNTMLNGNITIKSSFNVSGTSILKGNVTINGSINVSNNTIIQGSTTILGNLLVSGNTNLIGNLYVSGNTTINNATTIISNLYISGYGVFNNGLNTPIINGYQTLNIYGNTINIGNSNSIINIMGNSSYIDSNYLVVADKSISLNLNSTTGTGFDNGGLSGIQILGSSGTGFIQTTADASQFQILPPTGGPIMYIATIDLNNNLYITGVTLFNNNTTLYSQLFVSGNTVINGTTTINSNINVLGNTILNGPTTILSSLYVSGNSIINGNTTIVNSLKVSNNTISNSNISIIGSLIISGISILNDATTFSSNLYISGNSLFKGMTTIMSSLYVSGNTNILGNTTINSTLLVNANSILNGKLALGTNLTVSNNTILNGSVIVGSNLLVSTNSALTGNITLGASLNILGNIISNLIDYPNNQAASAAGVPIWGYYRTGGIIKIRLDDIPPIIYLTGNTTIYSYSGSSYLDPGVYAIDNVDGYVIPYLTSISNTSTSNIITSSIAITDATIISNVSTLTNGTYTIIYTATDNAGNIGNNYRLLNIITVLPIASLQFNSSNQYFTRLFNTNNSKQWTISVWLYCNTTAAFQSILSSYRTSGGYQSGLIYKYNSFLRSWALNIGGSGYDNLASVAMIASNTWTHVVIIYDSTLSTVSNRYKCYFNNVLQTNIGSNAPANGSNVSLNEVLYEFANPTTFYIGNRNSMDSQYNGYISQFIFVDNQALTPSSFGYLNSNSEWAVKLYSGTFGPSGYYLNFTDSSNVGLDSSGNNNNWIPNGLSSSNINYSNIIPQ